jgi:hypothetical protein
VPAARLAQLTGDEPHYLLTAISIGEDGSLDVADEVAAGRFRAFHAADLDPQARPLPDGRLVEPHDPLLPALLAGPVAAGGWLAAKLALAALAGVLGALLVWIAVRRLAVSAGTAALVVVLLGASAPLAVYGAQVYPELPAGLAVAVGVAALTGRLRAGGLAALAAATIALPWLSVKYAPLAAALALPAFARLARPRRLVAASLLLAALGVGAAAFLVAHRAWYGGWTPYAAGDHFVGGELTVVGHDPDYAGRSRRLLGLLVDRTFGLAAWQPAWLLLVPAAAALLTRRPRGWPALALPLCAGWLVATFVALTMHGWWFPGRQLVAVLPLGVLALAWWACGSRGRLRALLGLGALGAATHVWLLAEGYAGGITLVVDFFDTSNPWYRAWRLALPDHMSPGPVDWVLTGVWTALVAAAAVYAKTGTFRACGRTDTRAPSGTTSLDGRWETSTVSSSLTR